MKRLLFALASLLFFPFACVIKKNKTTLERNGIYYFESWAGYYVPLNPTNEITKEQAEATESKYAYYIGHYEKGLLMVFEQYIDKKIQWRDIYTYWPNTKILQKREMFHFDPTVEPYRVQNFDQKGNIIK